MASNFLQRFKGKTQTISKQGLHTVLGSRNSTASSVNPHLSYTQPSMTTPPSTMDQYRTSKTNQSFQTTTFLYNQPLPLTPQQTNKPTKKQSKYLLAEYLSLGDEEELEKQRRRIEGEKRVRGNSLIWEDNTNSIECKTATKNSCYLVSVDRKREPKEWVRLGGLGANIGGEDWMQRKRKLQKMQQFSSQVKAINADRIPYSQFPPAPRPQPQSPRHIGLQYSKSIPKPIAYILPSQTSDSEISHAKKPKINIMPCHY